MLKSSIVSGLMVVSLALVLGCRARADQSHHLLLLRYPTMSKTKIAFEYGGEIWEVSRSGGQAHVLASGMDMLTKPIFSPDGSQVAFTGTYDHNTDVYVVSAAGGQPRRLTYHPGPDVAVGWTPDGKRILFRSRRYSYSDPNQLFTVAVTGGFPKKLPLPMAQEGSYSPNGRRLAYVPNFQWEPYWKDYKGGQHTQIWVAKLSNSSVVRIPDDNADEQDPMWVGHNVYFLANRNGAMTLYRDDVNTGKVNRLIDNTGFDITSASAGPGGIVYSQFGQIHIYDFATGKSHRVPISVRGDLPQRRPHFENVAKQIRQWGISPKGARAVFQAHGDILTVPATHGSIENLTHSPGAMDRDPAWSPNGKRIAYFSDRDGEYDLYIASQNGTGAVRRVPLDQNNAFYYNLRWSPDSTKLVFSDQKLQLWYVNLATRHPKPVKIDTDSYLHLSHFNPTWSPDNRFIAYTRVLPNYLHAIFIYSLATGKTHQVTTGLSDCRYPVFGPHGKYLYFTSSTDTALSEGSWLDMSGMERPVTRHVYAATLQPGTPPAIPLKAGFAHTGKAEGKQGAKTGREPAAPMHIDFAGLASRATPLPIKPANYKGLAVGQSGALYLLKAPVVVLHSDMTPHGVPDSIEKFNFRTQKTHTLAKGVTAFALAYDGKQILYRKGSGWYISAGEAKAKPETLPTKHMKVHVVPQKQWAEMYHDAWRIERSFFYSPIYDGLHINAAEKEFAHYLPGIASRSGLTFLFREMLSYMSVGHEFIYGGYQPKMQDIKVGLLGANYRIEHDRYRITKIFTSGRWNPNLYAPLAQPGEKVKVGDYLLAVNGKPLKGSQNIYQAFENLANKTVTLTVGPNPSMHDTHQIVVKTIPSEHQLRNAAWVRHNRDVVKRLSHGKLGYVYLPDTYWNGYKDFNREYFAAANKQGVIIDERFNHGGDLSDYIIQYLKRKPMALGVQRWGRRKTSVMPPENVYGPKVMVINQFSGSGGDALPWYFKMDKIGPLVGVRTWGGLVGIGGYPKLMDGGTVTAPHFGVEGLHGTFPVENHGISPTVKVWQNPELVREGKDPQLDRAVHVALKELQKNPPKRYSRPPWRNYHETLPPLPKLGGGH